MKIKNLTDKIIEHPLITGTIIDLPYLFLRMPDYFERTNKAFLEYAESGNDLSKLIRGIILQLEPFLILIPPALLMNIKERKFRKEKIRKKKRLFEHEKERKINLIDLLKIDLYDIIGKGEKAIEKAQDIIEKNPNNGTAYFELIDHLFSAGREREAFIAIEDFLGRNLKYYVYAGSNLRNRAEVYEGKRTISKLTGKNSFKNALLSLLVNLALNKPDAVSKRVKELEYAAKDNIELKLVLAGVSSRILRSGLDDSELSERTKKLYADVISTAEREEERISGEFTHKVRKVKYGKYSKRALIAKETTSKELEIERRTNETLERIIEYSDIFVPSSIGELEEDGKLYYLMEEEDGETLFDKIRKGKSLNGDSDYIKNISKCAQVLAVLQTRFPIDSTLPQRDYKKDIESRLEGMGLDHSIINKIVDSLGPITDSISSGRLVASFDAHPENFIIHPRGITKIDNCYTRNDPLEMDYANLLCYGDYLSEGGKVKILKEGLYVFNNNSSDKIYNFNEIYKRFLDSTILRSLLLVPCLSKRETRKDIALEVIKSAKKSVIILEKEKYTRGSKSCYNNLKDGLVKLEEHLTEVD